ncbi:RidA family protein [Ottowia thiooxydans]|uniref:RidA family protein n=1 Tax=Ottowia thiooxydans TaxID=219182 RepID=UPI00042A6C95|nr:RidA family protein [Ottowia thiooxydans]
MNSFQQPASLAKPNGFSHTARAQGGTTIYVSGQVAYDNAGSVVGEGDLAAQTRQVYFNIQQALQAQGASTDDIVKTVLFVRDLDTEKARVIREVRASFLRPDGPPASTMVGVSSLARPELLLEVEAIAVVY